MNSSINMCPDIITPVITLSSNFHARARHAAKSIYNVLTVHAYIVDIHQWHESLIIPCSVLFHGHLL